MVMRWLIQEWIAQWLGLRDRLRGGRNEPDHWWVEMRERILRFLVSRYMQGEEPDAEEVLSGVREARGGPEDGGAERPTFCRVMAEDHPPRTCADLSGKLRSVSRINATKRARWRWI